MRKVPFIQGEYYHVYNRGVDKRTVFKNKEDIKRFFQSMKEFNTVDSIGSIYEKNYQPVKTNLVKDKKFGSSTPKKLVEFVAYCLNPNHYHFIITPLADNGIEKFMQKLGTGYTNYFNKKYKRSGSLFQGRYKASHIDSNEYLLYVSVYVNLNYKVHNFGSSTPKIWKSSWNEYIKERKIVSFCNKGIVLGQFKNKKDYEQEARRLLKTLIYRKEEMKSFLIEE